MGGLTAPWPHVPAFWRSRRSLPAVIVEALELLRCPHCGAPLDGEGGDGTLRCAAGHAFDVARQGYVNLLPPDADTGTADTAEMVAARDAFLSRGHYAPIADSVAGAVQRLAPAGGAVLDLGTGTGYYLAAVLDLLPERAGLALDISKQACRRAARAHPRAAAVVCDAWRRLPVGDARAAAVLSVFSPRNPAEIARVLEPGGILVVVTPTPRHLRELIGPLGLLDVDERKRERLDRKLSSRFEQVEERELEYVVELDHGTVSELVGMGPSAYHVKADALSASVAALPDLVDVTVSVAVSTFRGAP
jgi:23S rRNA (guanine745-N1)-methyltransferase